MFSSLTITSVTPAGTPVRRREIIAPLNVENNTIVDCCFGSRVEELCRAISGNQIARPGIALCRGISRGELQQIRKTVKVKVICISSVTAVVRATEVLNTPCLQIRNSCPGESNVERIFVCVVARDVQGSGSHAERGRSELDGKGRASARCDWRSRSRCDVNSAASAPSNVYRETGQICSAQISNCERV